MTASDPWDDDDAIFQDATTLDLLEAQAIQSSQVPKPRQTQKYHHTVAQPKAGPSKSRFGGRKEPAPLNTEPRAGVGGFGWQHGGKRVIEGNVERYVQQVNDRQAYWSHGNARPTATTKIEEHEEEEYPDVVMKEDGAYGFDGEAEIVDKKGLAAIQAGQDRQTQAAAARRAAIVHNTNAESSSSSKINKPAPAKDGEPNRFPTINRTLSRSVSAGHHPISRPTSRGAISALPPIPSQSEMQLPSSQGSLARKAALELDEERQKREKLEAELARTQLDLVDQQQKYAELREKTEMETDHTEVLKGQAEQATQGGKVEDVEKRIKELQNEVWRAKGEVETIRRAQKEEHAKQLAEADRLRAKLVDADSKLRERDREAARQVENVKTQAVFANHAAHNSAIKARAASQRPMPTPLRGSPRGKGQEESFLLRTGQKGKGKAFPPPPPAPRFEALNNAFSATPTVSRVKRQRTESVFPELSPSPTRASPKNSPRKNTYVEGEAGPSSPSPMVNDVVMVDDEGEMAEEATQPESDLKAELLYHLFNHLPMSPFQQYLDKHAILEPTIYRLLHYRPPEVLDTEGMYGRLCGDLLRACGDGTLEYEGLLEVVAEVGMGMLRILLPALDLPSLSNAEVAAIINILALFSRSAWLFNRFIPLLCQSQPSPTSILQGIVNKVFAPPKAISELQAVLDVNANRNSKEENKEVPVMYYGAYKQESPPPAQTLNPKRTIWVEELALGVGELVQTICWYAGGLDIWNGEELVDIALGLTSSHLDISIVSHGVAVIWSASTFKENFRPLMTQTSKSEDAQPVIDRISRLLLSPPTGVSEDTIHNITTLLLRSLAMLSIADRDAILLVGQRSLVVPALILLLRRESNKVWGVWIEEFDLKRTLGTITIALTVLHHLIYPHPIIQTTTANASQKAVPGHTSNGPDPPLTQAASQQPNGNGEAEGSGSALQGINFVERIRELSTTTREFHGIGHVFMSCLGIMSYGQPVCIDSDEIEKFEGIDLNQIQEMSQDVLEALVEGPEEEAVYELYADDEDEENRHEAGETLHMDTEELMRGKDEQDDEVDKEVYDAILVEDDSD